MRKIIRFLLIVLFSLPMFTSCDRRPGDESDSAGNSSSSTTELSTFIGAFQLTATELLETPEQVSWYVTITSYPAQRSNLKSWVKIESLYGGREFFNAYGYYDSKYRCIRIPAGIIEPDKNNAFCFPDVDKNTYYLASFMPCFTPNNGQIFYQLNDPSDEMWLCVQADGTLRLQASEFPSKELGLYANCFTIFFYYENDVSQGPENNYMTLIGDATLSRITSAPEHRTERAVSSPKRLSRLSH